MLLMLPLSYFLVFENQRGEVYASIHRIPESGQETEIGVQLPELFSNRRSRGALPAPDVPDNPLSFPDQYHWTALLMPLRLSYFSASVSVEALQRKVKLYDVYGASTTDALILKQ